MRRIIVIAAAGLSLAGCSSFSLDSFKSAPPPMQVQLDSAPQGADAVTSIGPGCKTPCAVSIPAPEANFTVTFNMPKFQPATVTRTPGDITSPATTTLDPSPVFAELQPAGPPPRGHKAMRPKKKKPKPAAAAAHAAAPDAAPPAAAAPTR